jgi:acyl transferase domain-containing protein
MAAIGWEDGMQEIIDRWIERKQLPQLLDLWTRGLNLDWHRLYGDVKPRRISLPTYPFAKEHYWIDETLSQNLGSKSEMNESLKSIEEIINQIGDDVIETEQAVQALKMLV